MIFDLDEFQEAKEKKRLVYHAPLPMKKATYNILSLPAQWRS